MTCAANGICSAITRRQGIKTIMIGSVRLAEDTLNSPFGTQLNCNVKHRSKLNKLLFQKENHSTKQRLATWTLGNSPVFPKPFGGGWSWRQSCPCNTYISCPAHADYNGPSQSPNRNEIHPPKAAGGWGFERKQHQPKWAQGHTSTARTTLQTVEQIAGWCWGTSCNNLEAGSKTKSPS